MTSVIVVAVDMSVGSAHALSWAVTEAARRGASLHIVHVLDDADREVLASTMPSGSGPEAVGLALLGSYRHMAERLAPRLVIGTELLDGHPAEALTAIAATADLLVLGSNGAPGYSVSALGSVAHRVAVHARCPVVVARPPEQGPRHHRVVAGIGDGPGVAGVLDYAATCALATDSELLLVRGEPSAAVSPAPPSGTPSQAAVPDVGAELRERHEGLRVRQLVVAQEPTLVLIGATRTADLLVLGSRHAEDPFEMRLGSVCAAVLPFAECPVALVAAH